MSLLDCNSVSGDGDGVKHGHRKLQTKRTPVPSCRRFATRHHPKNDNTKTKLEDALRELSASKTPVRCKRVRAQTMAEITPSKKKFEDLKLAGDGASRAPLRQEDAGRRVYQQLLLNAWRRRRDQVATLCDSSRRLQAQVDQLQIQVDVLQKLRESESKRRSEAASESTLLKNKSEELLNTIELFKKNEISLKEDVDSLRRKIEDLHANTQNIKNDLISAKTEITAFEQQLEKERKKNCKLREDKKSLVDKISQKDVSLMEQEETIRHLKEALEEAENNLENANSNNSNLEESRSDLSLKLEKENELRVDIQKQYTETKKKEEKLERKVSDLRKSICALIETKKNLLADNQVLVKAMEELQINLKDEKEKTWWKNAMGVVLDSLQNAAHVMLPAFPRKFDEYTSTTDLVLQS